MTVSQHEIAVEFLVKPIYTSVGSIYNLRKWIDILKKVVYI
jgi:hypothetical protein